MASARHRRTRHACALALMAIAAFACVAAGCDERAISLDEHQRTCTPSMTDYKTDLAQPTDTAYLPTPGN